MNSETVSNCSRSYRISTRIKEDYGVRLEKLQTNIRTECGKKAKICELIEMAIETLESDRGKDVKT